MVARKASAWLALGWFIGALLLLADGAACIRPTAVGGALTYYVVVHRNWSIALAPAFGLFGALNLGVMLGLPIRLRPALGWTHLAVMAVGAALTQTPQLALLCGGTPERGEDLVKAFRVWDRVAALGAALMGLGLLIFVWALVEGMCRRRVG